MLMRRPNRWARLTPARVRHREAYAAYLTSAQWRRIREAWLQQYRRRHGDEPTCQACGRAWSLSDDLHHRTYRNLGQETFDDLLPLCRPCHERLHGALDRSPTWRRLDLQRATHLLTNRLRENPKTTTPPRR
jgi:hypothetical protein